MHVFSFVAVMYFYGSDAVYVVVREKRNPSEAAAYCTSTFDGDLATIQSSDDLARVNQLLLPLLRFDEIGDGESFSQFWVAGRTDEAAHLQVNPDTEVSASGKDHFYIQTNL